MTMTYMTTNAEETIRLGERIGRILSDGIVIALIGKLGAGKTTLVKGIARGLGVKELIHSPTFTLIHEHKGRIPLYHFDLYRITEKEELHDIGYEEYFYGSGVTVIEWPEKIIDLLPPDHLEIHITGEDDHRDFEFHAKGAISKEILRLIQK